MAFMISYGLGALLFGFYADKMNLKTYLVCGLFPAAFALLIETLLIFFNKVNV